MRYLSESNPENYPRPRRRRAFRGPSQRPCSPWWDLSDIKPGLDRKQFAREMAGIQDRLSELVPYLDNLEERSVLVEAWHLLERFRLSRRRQWREE